MITTPFSSVHIQSTKKGLLPTVSPVFQSHVSAGVAKLLFEAVSDAPVAKNSIYWVTTHEKLCAFTGCSKNLVKAHISSQTLRESRRLRNLISGKCTKDENERSGKDQKNVTLYRYFAIGWLHLANSPTASLGLEK